MKFTFTIEVTPRTKKNSQQIVRSGGRLFIVPSKAYREYEKACKEYMPQIERPIDYAVNVCGWFYMPTRRRVDLVNLQEALLDVLVTHKVLADDNCTIVASMDGSRVLYDKEHPRTEVTITEV